MSHVIRFHLKTSEYGFLSNFAPYPITIDGVEWPTSEHYYQASKFINDRAWMEAVRIVSQPYDAWRMGRSLEHVRRDDWDEVKDDVMLRALRAKFAQHAEVRSALLATGEAILVEHSSKDNYWGDGGDGSGRNRLGQLLMQVRDELIEREAV